MPRLAYFLYLCTMKKNSVLLFGLIMLFSACSHDTDSLIGTWTVSKVNVQFDERRSTPELVKQMGEMERQNVITISKDSVLTFKGLEENFQGRINLESDGTLLFDGAVFGQWKAGQIVTRTDSPIGEIVVVYCKK